MADLLPAARLEEIIRILELNDGFAGIAELTEKLKVSHMTVRRDLQKLENDGRIVQVVGGARLVRRVLKEMSHLQKAGVAAAEKDRIGNFTAAQIPEKSCIYLDAGTTSLAVCRYIKNREDLTVISNDFEVIKYLSDYSGITLIHTGGAVNKDNRSCVGHLAAATINSLRPDIAFLSASSWDLSGITTPDPDKVTVKQAVAASAARRILIADSGKYGQTALFLAVPLKYLNAVITDTGLHEDAAQQLRERGLEVFTV